MKKLYVFLIIGLLSSFVSFGQIDAVTETTPSLNGCGGGIFPLTANDTLNGNPVTVGTAAGNVTISVVAVQGGLSIDPLTGVVTVPINTPAGMYDVTYTICEVSNPLNCDTVTSHIVVGAPLIDAVIDDYSIFPALAGYPIGNVLANDTLNGAPTVVGTAPGYVIITSLPTTYLTMDSSGTIFVAPNTPAGLYSITYTICEVNNPTNCDTVTDPVRVGAPIIDAEMENITALPGATVNLISNDYFNNSPVTVGTGIGDVNITVGATQGGLSMNTSTGEVTIPPNIPTGSYFVTYTICEVTNPNNCDTVTSTISIGCSIATPVVSIQNINCSTQQYRVAFNNLPPTGTWTIQLAGVTYQGTGTGYMVNSNFNIGSYTAIVTNNQGCSVNLAIQIEDNYFIIPSATGVYVDFNGDGFVNVGDVINYQYSVRNIGDCSIANVQISNNNNFLNLTGNTITSIGVGVTNTTDLTATHVITQSEITMGSVLLSNGIVGNNFEREVYLNTPLNVSDGVRLNVFEDTNSNGIQDSGELNYPYAQFTYQLNSGNINNLYTPNGYYYIYENSSSNVYNIACNLYSSYASCGTQYTLATSSYSNVTIPTGSGITTLNFPISVVNYCNDVEVGLNSWSSPMPGFIYSNYVYYKNNGTQTVPSGTITFTKDNALSILNTWPSSSTTATGFTYNFTNLLPNESRRIYVDLAVPNIPTVNLGQLVTNTVSISPPLGDINAMNDSSTIIKTIVGAYDPNDKSENHGGKIVQSTFTANDYLTYTIRFENTGTANAINIRVNDILDAKLDETTIKMVDASAPYVLDRVGTNLNWKFDGINLPPSSVNSPTIGHGYLTFQIKPKAGYAVGDIIPNTANIYFDFNPAIVTNTCTTEFVTTLSNDNFASNEFQYYPNPVKDILYFESKDSIQVTSVSIYNSLGQQLLEVTNPNKKIDVSSLKAGNYFIKIVSDKGTISEKIVKE